MPDFLALLLVGLVGGAVNAVAGGAKLFVFPLLLGLGLPPVIANATGTVALWPAPASAVWVYRRELKLTRLVWLRMLCPALIGGATGAIALIVSGEKVFLALVPGFILLAVIAIALGKQLPQLFLKLIGQSKLAGLNFLLLFIVGFYGGFFGAGIGFMLLAVLALDPESRLHTNNAYKNLLVLLINSAAVIPLAISGLVDWNAAPLVLVGGIAGGAAGAHLAQRIPERPMRFFIAVTGLVLSANFLFFS